MANDKKFIVKNGLQTEGDVLIGTGGADDGVSILQANGAVKFTASFPSYPTLHVINDTGTVDSPIIEFEGPSGALSVRNIDTNDFGIFNGTQAAGSGIEFHQGGAGNGELILKRAGNEVLSFTNGNTSFTGLSTTNIEGRRIITTDDQSSQGGSFDAATLDGIDSTQFVRSDEDDTMDGSYIITGNLTVQGVTTSINSEVVTIADNILQLNSNVTGAPTENSGIEIVRGTSDNVSLIWNETSDWWSVGTYSFESDEIRSTNTNDLTLRAPGSGSSNVNITAGFGDSYTGLKSVKDGSAGYGQILYNNTEQLRATSQGIDISNDLQVDGDITVGDNNAPAQIFFNGTGLNSTLYSNAGEIGFLKANLNYGAYLNSDEDWIVAGNNEVQGNIISEGDITAYDNIFANTNITATNGNIEALVGDITAGDDITANNNITALNGDIVSQSGQGIFQTDVTAVTGNVDAALDVTAGQDVIATRDITAGRNAEITGDLTANNATITNDLTANNATFFFVNANSAIIGDISANNITADQDIRSGRFVDNDDDTYYFDGDKTTVANTIGIDTWLFHNGDPDTKLGFPDANQIDVYAGSNQSKIEIRNTKTTFKQEVGAQIYYGETDTSYWLDLDATQTGSGGVASLAIQGAIQAGAVSDFNRMDDTTGGGITIAPTSAISSGSPPTIQISGGTGTGNPALLGLNKIGAGNNPYSAGNRFIHFANEGANATYFAGDAFGNLNIIPQNNTQAMLWWDDGGTNLFSVNFDGNIVVGSQTASYTDGGDNTPVTTAMSNARMHVNGSLYLNGANDGLIIGRGTASFLRTDELGFSSGGGFYMNDTNFIRIRNDKNLTGTGTITGSRFIDSDNANYYTEPGDTSQMSQIDIDDYIRHRGDVNTYFGFQVNDTFRVFTNGTQRLNIDNNSADFTDSVYAPIVYDSNDTAYYFHGGDTSVMNRIHLDDWIMHKGDTNTYFGFLADDTIRFFTNGANRLTIANTAVTSTVDVYGPRFIDTDNNNRFVDPSGRSELTSTDFSFNTASALASNNFNVAKTIKGTIHVSNGAGVNNTNGLQAAITFQGDIADESQAGIYVHNNNNDGTAMAFATTDSYATGPQIAQRIYNSGRVDFPRSFVQATNSFRAPIFYDSDNITYFGNFAGESRMATIKLDDGVVLRSPNGTYGSFAIDGQARGGWEGFSIGDRMVFMHDNSNRVGVFNDVDDEWIWYADRNNAMRLMYNGSEQFRTENGYAIAGNQMRSPIFYDSNNTSYYGDFASTSIMNVVRVNRLQIDSSSYYIDTASGNYGTIRVEGVSGSSGTWAGYAIRDDWVFMANGPSEAGIYNDTNNEWAIKFFQNNRAEIMYNGTIQAQTQSNHFDMLNQARAPIYYDRNNTGYYGDFASHSRMSSVSFGNQGAIANNTYAMSAYHNNRYLLGLRYSGAGGAYPWMVHDNWNGYDGTSRNAFIVHFNGVGDRYHMDEAGNFRAFKSVSAPDISLDGGNEPLSLSPAYGTGGADLVLFDGTYYFDNRVTNSMAPNENSLTTNTSEFVRATTGPFAGSYVLRTSGYRDFYSAFIPVEPGEELYGEMSVRRISGSGGVVYYGIERYDQNKNEISGNAGTTYFVVSGANQTSTSWQTYRNYHTLPSNVYYVRIRILMNYNAGGALREYAGIMLKRSNYHGRLRGDDIVVTGDVTADRFYDRNDTSYYLDPASTSYVNDIRFNIGYDRNNTSYYINPASTSRLANIDIAPTLSNGQARIRSIMTSGYPALEYSDSAPGNSSGDQHFVWGANDTGQGRMQLRWRGGTAFGSAWYNEGTLLAEFIGDNNAVQFPQSAGVRTPIYYDYNDTNYYGDFASTSRFYRLRLSQSDSYLKVGSNSNPVTTLDTNRPQIEIGNQHAYPHFTLNSWGTNTNHGAVISFRSRLNSSNNVRRWNIGTANYQAGSLDFGYYDNQDNPHYGVGVSWSQSAYTRFLIRTGYTEAKGSMRSPIFYDTDNTGYYGNFASTSRMNQINVNTTYHVSGGVANFQTSAGNTRGFIQATDTNDAHFIIATSGGEDISFRDGGVSGQWNMIVRGDGDTLINRYIYAQRFYDRNNSSYYTDPAGTSRLATITVDRVNMADRGDFITFYGDDSTYHSISSRDNGGSTADDLRFNTYGNIWINLDSNNNNSSSADFRIGRHGAATGSIQNLGLFDVYGDSLYVYTAYSFRSPIYYDSNNTGYYIDAASTSRLNTLRTNRLYTGYDSSTDDYLDYPTGDYGGVQINGGGKNGWEGYSINGRYVFMSSDNNQVGIYNDIDNEWMWYGERNGRTYFYYNGRYEARTDSGYFRIERQARAPIYYDLNNTGYYLDPASTSVLYNVNFNGYARFKARQNDSAGSHSSYDVTGTDYLNNVAAEFWSGNDAPVTIYFRSGVNAPSDYGYITFDPDFNNTGENAAMVIGVDNDGTGSSDYIRLQGRVELHSNLSSSDNSEMQGWWYQTTKYARLNTDYFDHISDIRSPIFYDRNNTGYYADMASTSRFNTMRTNRLYPCYDNNSGVYFDYPGGDYGSIQVNGGGRNGWEGYSINGRYVFMSADSNQMGIYNDVDNEWMLYGERNSHLWLYWNGRWEARTDNGYFRIERSSRAPLFYDLNNTGYYVDPASTSRLANITANFLQFDNGFDIYDDDSNTLSIRSNDSDNGEIILRDSNGTACGRIYWDDDNHFGLKTGGENEWVLYSARNSYTYIYYNGRWEARADSGYWRAERSSRAPIFYDLNNTAYYFNGASSHSTRFEGANNRTMAWLGQPGHTRDSGEYYRARPRITSDTNYWTGSYGWGRLDMTNSVADWGSGFIDSWSNPANQPSGTSHWVGIQAYHYSNGSARYGWQMVGGPIGNLRFRNTWSSFSSWRTVPILDVNSSNGGSMYAGRYYDSNNTGYYTDPASTSNMNQVRAYVFDFNGTGGDSNRAISSYPYELFQTDGGWSNPYPALRINYHVGIDFGANPSYQGYRFMNDYNSNTVRFQINGGSSYTYKYTWMYTNTTGMYSGTNGAHIYPNEQTSYGSWNMLGNRNGWYGLAFSQADNDPHLMFDNNGAGRGGLYWQGGGRWALFYDHTNNCLGIASSSTSSTYELYVSGDIYATGNIVAYSDRRRKRNIETLDNALEKVLQLRGVTYNKLVTPNDEIKDVDIADYLSEDGEKIKNTEIGVIAQEVDEVVPELVSYADDVDEYSVSYGNMAALFIEAFKDQQNIINSQQEQIDELKSMVQTLMEKL